MREANVNDPVLEAVNWTPPQGMVEADVVGLNVISWPAAPSAVSFPRMYRWIHESAVTVTRGSILSVTPGSTVTFPTMCHAGHDKSQRSSIVRWPVLSHGKIGPAAYAVVPALASAWTLSGVPS